MNFQAKGKNPNLEAILYNSFFWLDAEVDEYDVSYQGISVDAAYEGDIKTIFIGPVHTFRNDTFLDYYSNPTPLKALCIK